MFGTHQCVPRMIPGLWYQVKGTRVPATRYSIPRTAVPGMISYLETLPGTAVQFAAASAAVPGTEYAGTRYRVWSQASIYVPVTVAVPGTVIPVTEYAGKHNCPCLGRGRSLNFRFLDSWAVQTSKAAPAAGPFEQLPQLLGHSNGCPRTSKRQLCFVISMLVAIKAANVSSAAAAVRFPPPYPLLLITSADSMSYLVLNFYRYTTALSPKISAPPPASPRRHGSRCCCCCYCCWCLYCVSF